MRIATRVARADDRAAIWALYQSAMRARIEAIWGWDEDWQIADFGNAFSASATLVVETNAEMTGYIQLDINAGEMYLRMIVLAPHVRSRGIGAKLVAEINRISQQAGYAMHLRVFRANIDAKRFYEREGWRVKAEEDAFFLMTHPLNGPGKTAVPLRELRAQDVETVIEAGCSDDPIAPQPRPSPSGAV
jgi:ribosomal protein S18 acetylase RimI-like enzyme